MASWVEQAEFDVRMIQKSKEKKQTLSAFLSEGYLRGP